MFSSGGTFGTERDAQGPNDQFGIDVDLKADSLDIICLVVTLEDTLGVGLSDADTSKLYDGTVLDVVAVVEAAQLAASPKEAVDG